MDYSIETKAIQNYFQCSISFHNIDTTNIALMRSLLHSGMLCNPIILSKYKKLQFVCLSILPLHQYIAKIKLFHPFHFHKIIFDITNQVKYLIEVEKKSFLGFHPNHIYVVDHNKFIYLSGEYICNLKWNPQTQCKYMTIPTPITPNDLFYSPEYFNITSLPANVNYECCFYSLGVLFSYVYILQRKWSLHCLDKLSIKEEEEKEEDDYDSYENNNNDNEGLELVPHNSKEYETFQLSWQGQLNQPSSEPLSILSSFPIYNTKLFYFLKRCLQERMVVFI